MKLIPKCPLFRGSTLYYSCLFYIIGNFRSCLNDVKEARKWKPDHMKALLRGRGGGGGRGEEGGKEGGREVGRKEGGREKEREGGREGEEGMEKEIKRRYCLCVCRCYGVCAVGTL